VVVRVVSQSGGLMLGNGSGGRPQPLEATCETRPVRESMDIGPALIPIRSFEELLRPMSTKDFFCNHFGRTPLHLHGDSTRFAYMQTWETLNRILSFPTQALDFRLKKDGSKIPIETYSEPATDLFGNLSRVDLRKFQALCREGAMLSVRNFEIWDQQVSALCRLLESTLSCYMHAVAFVGWHSTRGFNTHWDAYDAFILQIDGRKRWRLFEPDPKHPLKFEHAPRLEPTRQTYWDGELEPGDLLYVPRGWWHDATPTGQLSLHVTIGGTPPTGVDLAQKVLEQLAGIDRLRETLPFHTSEQEKDAYLALFRHAILDIARDLTVDSYIRERNSLRETRDRVSLPWTAVPDSNSIPFPPSSRAHWLPSVPGHLQPHAEDSVSLEAFGRKFIFARIATPVLQDLMNERQIEVAQLCARYPSMDVAGFLIQLISGHLIAVSTDSAL
jgi:ribosomal protein L16 Arg81 hydroxylase